MDKDQIKTGMRVIDHDGTELGTVTSISGDGFATGQSGDQHRIGFGQVTRVDQHVHVNRDLVSGAAGRTSAAPGAARTQVSGRDGKPAWLWPLLAILALGVLLWALSQCSKRPDAVDQTNAAPPAVTETTTNTTSSSSSEGANDGAMVSELRSYLQSDAAAPKTFTFNRLNFDTGSSAIRSADQSTLASVAAALKASPKARVRIDGYADARGAEGANDKLGEQRAQAVVAALGKAGIASSRLEARSGGETNPRDTNASAQGRSENRRTELTVLSK